ncbi:MAG: restriction endonuclease subunit S [Planctomycetia bacterium]
MKQRLGDLICPAKIIRAQNTNLPVLSVTRHYGLVQQDTVFNKQIASRDTGKYLIVSPNQLVVGIHIDEGALAFSDTSQRGIVSPAYRLWDIREPDKVFSPYLNRLIRSPETVGYFGSHYRQTADRRGKIRPADFLALPVFLPPVPEQKRIAAILDASDALRAKRRESIEQLNSLVQATFLEMFGDPMTNPKRWEMGNIADLMASVSYGTSKKANPAIGEFPILRMGNITYDGGWDLRDIKFIDLDKKEQGKYLVRGGELLFNRTNSKELVGKTAVYRGDTPMAFAGYLVRAVTNERASPEYVGAFMNARQTKSMLQNMCKAIVGMANINASEFKMIRIPIPPRSLQDRFSSIVESIDHHKARLQSHLAELDTLFSSLQSRAFNGELVA